MKLLNICIAVGLGALVWFGLQDLVHAPIYIGIAIILVLTAILDVLFDILHKLDK
jgi:ABC-type nitrate/sulfonate/bicarbonate transport system permease component